MLYPDIVFRHFENPKNVGLIKNHTKKITIGSPTVGAVITISVLIKYKIINDVKFKAYGGGAIIASMSYLTDLVKGMRVVDALMIKSEEINMDLNLTPVKYIYSIMAIDCLHKVLKND